MRTRSLPFAFALLAGLVLSAPARADLPDLRGQTFFVTGTLTVAGTAFGQNFATLAPNGITIARSNQSRLIIQNSGLEDNSNLKGSFVFPVNPAPSPYPTGVNGAIPLAGSFNRSTGAFSMTGKVAGEFTVDFGVANITGIGDARIQVRFKEFGVTLTGTGAMTADGTFQIKQPGSSAFSFSTSGLTPILALQDPRFLTFGDNQDIVRNAALTLKNWIAQEPQVSGTLAFEGIDDLSGLITPIGPIDLEFRPVDGAPFQRSVVVDSKGNFVVKNVSVGTYDLAIKGNRWLRRVVKNVDATKDDVTGVATTLLPGDLDGDNVIGLEDLVIFFDAYGSVTGDANWSDGIGDLNGDGEAGLDDLVLFFSHYGEEGE